MTPTYKTEPAKKRGAVTVRVTSISMRGEVLYTPEAGYTVSEAAGTRIALALLNGNTPVPVGGAA